MKILSVVGARPNLMQISPFARAVEEYAEERSEPIEHVLVHTGQHYDRDMSDAFFAELEIPPADHHLGVGSGSHAYQVGRTMIEFEKVLLEERPDWTVVVGDVNATAACSITAKKHHFRVAHIEAGLRSGDWTMPEEINRMVTDRICDLLLTPCSFADANLRAEGAAEKRIVRVGNIMIDTLEAQRGNAAALDAGTVISRSLVRSEPAGKEKNAPPPGLSPGGYGVLTLHRPSNVDDPGILGPLLSVFGEIAGECPLVFPVHPRTAGRFREFGLWDALVDSENLHLTRPFTYRELLCLNLGARAILTDSGGLQEEATVLGVPCLTLRENTERPVTLVENGGVCRLVGSDPARIRAAFSQIGDRPREERRPELWDGRAAGRVVAALVERG